MSAADARLTARAAPALEGAPLDDAERDTLFTPFLKYDAVLLAVSGGPDSTALAHLAAAWAAVRAAQGLPAPRLVVATVDHSLRPEAAREAEAVAALCARLGLAHSILVWRGAKPLSGIQEAARAERYALLLHAARAQGIEALALAHTLDDQAETVLFRLARGSGLTGLGAMRPESRREDMVLLRPFLGVPKARLVGTLRQAGISFVEDPSNTDPRFTRPRLRALAPLLAAEGLDAGRLALLASRAARAEAALLAGVEQAAQDLSLAPWGPDGPVQLDLAGFKRLPEEIGLRLLGRAVDFKGHEGPAELAKLEALFAHLAAATTVEPAAFRRTLAGALVAIRGRVLSVSAAPERGKSRGSR